MTLAAYVAALHGALGDAGRRLVRLPRLRPPRRRRRRSPGWPGMVRSGSTRTRPGAVGRRAGRLGDGPREPGGRGRRPPRTRSSPRSPPPSHRGRSPGRRPRRGRSRASASGPRRRASRAGAGRTTDRSGGYAGRTRSIASTRMIRVSPGLIDRKSRRSVSWAISPSAPASSTPVGPPPTITNVIQARRRSGSASRSAASKAMRMRRRISVASSMVLSPGATAAHSGWSK